MSEYHFINKEDYEEPTCILCDPQTGMPEKKSNVPLARVMEKLDECCGRKDFAGAERHLRYWLKEARFQKDLRGEFGILNEMMGFYRKQSRMNEAFSCAEKAVVLIDVLQLEGTESAATCYINSGTVYDSFGDPEKALGFFEKARRIFESSSRCDAFKLGGLYNNMALALSDLGRYEEAIGSYKKALDVMRTVENGQLEQAITYLNMADAVAEQTGFEDSDGRIDHYVKAAASLFETPQIEHDAYYAFVCEKCAPGFYCYGYSDIAEKLEKQAEEIYDNNFKTDPAEQ